MAAAFIGPGTVTICIMAGVGFGYALLWALLLATGATMVLQEMAARLGIVTGRGLGENIRGQLTHSWAKYLVLGIVIAAIIIGNAAYEAGNMGGAVLGMEAVFGNQFSPYYPWIISFLALLLLWQGNYQVLERVFVVLVLIMSLSFILTLLMTGPDLVSIIKGLFVPSVPAESLLTIVALVGTTVVPYNLFLHASLVTEKWRKPADLPAAQWDTYISVGLGGMVSMAILVCAAAIPSAEVSGALDLAKALEPLFGSWARYLMGIGLFAAGMTSAVTAPLAAAYVANSCFGWKAGMRDNRFRAVWMLILFSGTLTLAMGFRPIEVIRFAQVANGLLLPIIAIFLLWVVNSRRVMGKGRNSIIQNGFGMLIILLSVILGFSGIFKVFGS